MISSTQNIAPKPAMPPAAQPPALPANNAGGPSFAQFLTDQAAPPPPANSAPEASQGDEAKEAAQPAPAQPATRRAAAQPAKPTTPRATDAAPKADAKAEPTEDKLATDAVTGSADEDDASETPELKEFTQLLGMANAQPDAAAAALKPDGHRGHAATAADDDAPRGRATLQATDKFRPGDTPEPAAAKPGDLRADKAAARAAAAESLQVGTQQAGSDQPAAASKTQPATPSFAATLAQALPTPTALPADAAPATTYAGVQAPLHSNAFAPELGARVSLLAVDGVQQAELQLNPADMGPVSVQITVDGSQAQVSFHALQAETRQALEQSLPDLAAALQGQGLTLSGGGVFQQAPRDADHGEDRSDAGRSPGASRSGNDRVGSTAGASSAASRRTVGLLDTFA
jgi:flagellar hook-length control protein FliK